MIRCFRPDDEVLAGLHNAPHPSGGTAQGGLGRNPLFDLLRQLLVGFLRHLCPNPLLHEGVPVGHVGHIDLNCRLPIENRQPPLQGDALSVAGQLQFPFLHIPSLPGLRSTVQDALPVLLGEHRFKPRPFQRGRHPLEQRLRHGIGIPHEIIHQNQNPVR